MSRAHGSSAGNDRYHRIHRHLQRRVAAVRIERNLLSAKITGGSFSSIDPHLTGTHQYLTEHARQGFEVVRVSVRNGLHHVSNGLLSEQLIAGRQGFYEQ